MGTFLVAALLQILLFKSFVEREVAWNFVLHGDPTWYVYFCYKLFDALLRGDYVEIYDFAKTAPWGIVLFLESALTQLLFGVSRFGVVAVNLLYYLAAQIATYAFFRRVGGCAWSGIVAVLLFMAMGTPFRTDGPGLNISDFHFDLVFYFLLLGVLYLVAVSDTFAQRIPALLVAALAAILVATRLVSVFLLIGTFGVLWVFLLAKLWKGTDQDRLRGRSRVVNLLISAVLFLAFSAVPLFIAKDAVYNHYFRFVFDPEFRATHAGLYTMGAADKFGEAYQIVRIMLRSDFGWLFLCALLALAVLLILSRAGERGAEAMAPHNKLGVLSHDRNSRSTFISFLVIAIVISYVMHVAFPIQSDHLTRITAAPIFVLIAYLSAQPVAYALARKSTPKFWLAIGVVGVLGIVATSVQLSFYVSKGRYAERKRELIKVSDMYRDMDVVTRARGLTKVAISSDKIETFELGGLMSFFIYEYERNGMLLIPSPKLGAVIDQPISRDTALRLTAESDFVLLLTDSYPKNSFWPLMRSVQTFHSDLIDYARRNFCLLGSYPIDGRNNELYVRPFSWKLQASASTAQQYGPEGLLSGGPIWHAPWKTGATQWVSFEAPLPVRLSALSITAQDGAPTRAPRHFTLEAVDDSGRAQAILHVQDAKFETLQQQTWQIAAQAPARRYRLTVTGNNGDANLLTIQALSLTTAGLACEFGTARANMSQ
jgi:hypothetical protein